MPNKQPAKKAAKKTAKKTPKKANQLTIPKAGDLALVIEQELYKLPTESAHNHFHALTEKADHIREQAKVMSLVSLMLCALELEHIKKTRKGSPQPQSGEPWKEWVKKNCEFGYTTVTKYIKVLKHARAGDIKGLDPELVPEHAPSLMSADELRDVCENLANSLQGFGSRRQLYLELEVIKTPTRNTITDNRGKKTSSDEESNETVVDIDLKRKDATFAFRDPLKKIDTAMSREQYRYLPKETLEEIILALGEHAKALKNI